MQRARPDEGATPPRRRVRRPTQQLRTIQQLNEEFARHLRSHLTVNATDLDAMQHLIEDGALSPGELARRLGLSGGAVTSVVDRLEQAGHATREPHPTDRRALRVVPNPGSVGRALGEVIPMAARLDAVLDGFDERDQAMIARYLDAVIAAYRAHLDGRAGLLGPSTASEPLGGAVMRDERASRD